MKSIFILSLLCIFWSSLTYALDGWHREIEDGAIIYVPSKLKDGKTFRITITEPVVVTAKNAKDWFLNRVKNQQLSLGKPLQDWVVKPEKNGAWGTSNSYLDSSAVKMSVGYQGGRLKNGQSSISQMVSSQDVFLVIKYGKQFDDVIEDAEQYFQQNDSRRYSSDNERKKAENSVSDESVSKMDTSASSGWINPIEGLNDIRGVVVFAIQPGGLFGLTSEVIATFKDGSYTSDLKRVFNEGPSVSKAKKPGRWGEWRIKGGELQLKARGDNQFEATRGDWIARPGASNLRLNGCYGNITSASSSPYGGNSTVGNASSWCFRPDGRFAHSSTGFATASGDVMGGASSSRKTAGRYHIDGYVARFSYDDGKEIVTAFCFLNEKKSHIAINGKRYMGSD